MDGKANTGNDNISRQKVDAEKRLHRLLAIAAGDSVRKSKKAGIAPTFPFTRRQYIRGRGVNYRQ